MGSTTLRYTTTPCSWCSWCGAKGCGGERGASSSSNIILKGGLVPDDGFLDKEASVQPSLPLFSRRPPCLSSYHKDGLSINPVTRCPLRPLSPRSGEHLPIRNTAQISQRYGSNWSRGEMIANGTQMGRTVPRAATPAVKQKPRNMICLIDRGRRSTSLSYNAVML